MYRSLEYLLSSVEIIKKINFRGDTLVTGLCLDTRELKKGDLFFAMKGTKFDGHSFIPTAFEKGCSAVICQRDYDLPRVDIPVIVVRDIYKAMALIAMKFYDNPSEKLKIIGITGTTGKTTVAYLIKHILERGNNKTGLIGTINYETGNEKTKAVNTTPYSVVLYKLLHEMVLCGIQYVPMEVSSHSLEQDRVLGINFSMAIFTNLRRDHLDFHKTIEAYKSAKLRLFKELSPNSYAVINKDDPYFLEFSRNTSAKIISYGIKADDVDFKGEILEKDLDHTIFTLRINNEHFYSVNKASTIRTNLVGEFNVYNVLPAIVACLVYGVDLNTIKSALLDFKPPPGRLEKVGESKKIKVFIDFAHTPDALENVLKTLKEFKKNRLIVVFGCGGDRDKGKRPIMGRIAETFADKIIITSDNPRTEDPIKIIDDIVSGISDKTRIMIEEDRKKAISLALKIAEESDIVIIAGKGHENYQIFKDKVIPFDDKEVVLEMLKK